MKVASGSGYPMKVIWKVKVIVQAVLDINESDWASGSGYK